MPWKPLNPAAPGLLGMLQLKNMGRNPEGLLEDVRTTIDIKQFYMLGGALLAWRSNQLNPGYTGFLAPANDQFGTPIGTIIVPQGEYWWIHELTAEIATGLVDQTDALFAASLRVDLGNGTQHPIVGLQSSYGIGVLAPQSSFINAPSLRDLWAPPGARLGMEIGNFQSTNAGAPVAGGVAMSVRYTPVPI